MNKKLIALLLATLPAAAMADVTLYGDIEADVENGKALNYNQQGQNPVNGATFSPALKTVSKIDDTGSYIGFKGNEDLGNGLKAIWQVEQGLNVDGTSGNGSGNFYGGTWATRDTFVGLSSNFGTVKLGHISTYLNSDMEKVDPWIYGAGVNGLGTLTFNDTRLKNAIRYDAPQFVPGLKISAMYGFDETRNLRADGSRSDQGQYAFGLGYENSGFYGDLGYAAERDAGANLNQTAYYWRAEAGYNANNLLVAAAYQQTKTYGSNATFVIQGVGTANVAQDLANVNARINGGDANGDVKQDEAALTVGYTIGAFTPMASFAWGGDVKTNGTKLNDTGYKQWVLGVNYALSKRTNSYISYGQKKYDSGIGNVLNFANGTDKENTVAVGLQHKF
ncbi:porin [Crenobacter sp. SG2305]|uniref:porin n=1 Tax=Crenobacter oryzisoli TaxID=3056844 RepID=UPI0025AABC98|nr:porin [Crenobacter sp. SG2305]MDN0082165.1 porin [Crenobacter sp. SG2305]